jgi:hypothetical protein
MGGEHNYRPGVPICRGSDLSVSFTLFLKKKPFLTVRVMVLFTSKTICPCCFRFPLWEKNPFTDHLGSVCLLPGVLFIGIGCSLREKHPATAFTGGGKFFAGFVVSSNCEFVHKNKAFGIHLYFSDNFPCPFISNYRNLVREDESTLFNAGFKCERKRVPESAYSTDDKKMIVFALLAPRGLMRPITIGPNGLPAIFTTHFIPLIRPAFPARFTILRFFVPITVYFYDCAAVGATFFRPLRFFCSLA